MPRHLVIRLAAPLTAFGGETIDNHGVIRDFPARSMVTGLLANALGWRREDWANHDRLQTRLRMGARRDLAPHRLEDYQTARLFEDDQAWTTFGAPEGRAKSPTYTPQRGGRKATTQQRFRDYHADLVTLVALRLEPEDETPNLDDLAEALDRPARPLFIGRKPCLPNGRLFAGWREADNLLDALQTFPAIAAEGKRLAIQWPEGEGRLPGDRLLQLCDERDWRSGVHGGWRHVREGAIASPRGAGS
jgi:CRISPR system Cascade subunit CasD